MFAKIEFPIKSIQMQLFHYKNFYNCFGFDKRLILVVCKVVLFKKEKSYFYK